jgi:hypothetical protein
VQKEERHAFWKRIIFLPVLILYPILKYNLPDF